MIVAVNKDEITADITARLVAAQFPQWAGLPVTPVTLNGQDNTTFRLGDELSIRLPSASCVPQFAKEHRWLPVLARQLPLPIRSQWRWGARPLASTWEQAPVWVHGDLAASNMLADGALHAVIDFGGVAIGDPASTWSWNGSSSPVTALRHSAAACISTRRPGTAAAAGPCGRHSSTSARNGKEATTRKPQPTMTCSDGGTARARLSASSSPTTPDRPGAEPGI